MWQPAKKHISVYCSTANDLSLCGHLSTHYWNTCWLCWAEPRTDQGMDQQVNFCKLKFSFKKFPKGKIELFKSFIIIVKSGKTKILGNFLNLCDLTPLYKINYLCKLLLNIFNLPSLVCQFQYYWSWYGAGLTNSYSELFRSRLLWISWLSDKWYRIIKLITLFKFFFAF